MNKIYTTKYSLIEKNTYCKKKLMLAKYTGQNLGSANKRFATRSSLSVNNLKYKMWFR